MSLKHASTRSVAKNSVKQMARVYETDPWANNTDPYWNNTSLLIHADAANNKQNVPFIDESSAPHTITRTGDVTQGTFSPFPVRMGQVYSTFNNGGSAYFDGSGDYLALDGSSDFAFGTGDFTIEGWFYVTGGNGATRILFDTRPSGTPGSTYPIIYLRTTNVLVYAANTAEQIIGTTTIALNAWLHIACVRSSGVTKMYLNGVQEGSSYTDATNYLVGAGRPWIGLSGNDSTSPYTGYISNLHVVKGTALYTTNFAPPSRLSAAVSSTDPYASSVTSRMSFDSSITFDSVDNAWSANGGVAVSSAQAKFGASSGYFDGSNDSIVGPSTSGFAFGAGDFTVEMWVYPTSSTGYQVYYEARSATTQDALLLQRNPTTTTLGVFVNGSFIITSASQLATNAWTHIAVSRNSGTLRLYFNGTLEGSAANSSNYISAGPRIGLDFTGNTSSPFYVDDFRVTKGVGRYPAAFSTPTTATPFIGSTKLLCNFTNAGIRDETGKHNVAVIGDAKVSTAQYKFGGSALYFDGTGDYLQLTEPSLFGSAITIEAWIYKSATGDNFPIVSQGNTTYDWQDSTGFLFTFYIDPTNKLGFNVKTGNLTSTNTLGTTNVSQNTWHHVAGVINGNSIKIYLNGVEDGTSTATWAQGAGLATKVVVGSSVPYGGSTYANGYIDDLRITKGIARYTSSFNPSSLAFFNQASNPALTPVVGGGDAYWNAVVFANQGDTLTDLAKSRTVTVAGNTTPSTTQKKFGQKALYFDGTGDYLTLDGSSDFAFGTGDFTIEMWIYMTTINVDTRLYDSRSSQGAKVLFGVGATNKVFLYASSGALSFDSGSISIAASTWTHVALSRQSGVSRIFVNGVLGGSAADTTNYVNDASRPMIGRDGYENNRDFPGYLDDIRVTKGIARYTTTFSPPTAQFDAWQAIPANTVTYWDETKLLLSMDYVGSSTVFQDNSKYKRNPIANGNAVISNGQSKFGGFSGYFDGTGDYLQLGPSSDFAFGTGDLTVESWFYLVGTSGTIIDFRNSATSYTNLAVKVSTTAVQVDYLAANLINQSVTIAQNTWHHLAVSRASGTVRIFLNGIQIYSATHTSNCTDTGTTNIGIEVGNSATPLNGYIDDLRVTKGIARYTSNFIPPLLPHPYNTTTTDSYFSSNSLLLHADAANNANNALFVDSSSSNKSITRNGDVNQGTFSPFPVASGSDYSTTTNVGSAYFDGTGDYLTLDGSNDFAFGTGDFTIEMWVYRSVAGAVQTLYDSRPASTQGSYLSFDLRSTNVVAVYVTSAQRILGTITIGAGTWAHVALSRSSGTLRLFVNGVQDGSWADTTDYQNPANRPLIGSEGYTPNSVLMNGYISNLHVVKGTAKYTAGFTPSAPATEFSRADQFGSSVELLLPFNGSSKYLDTAGNEYVPTAIGTNSSQYLSATPKYHPYYVQTNNACELDAPLAPFNYSVSDPFTFDGWLNIAANADQYVFKTSGGMYLQLMANGTIRYSGFGVTITSTLTYPLSTWFHLAVVRQGSGALAIYLGGASVASSTTATAASTEGSYARLFRYSGTLPLNGKASDLRFTRAVRWTTPFTVPTAVADSKAKAALLLNFTNAAIRDETGKHNVTVVGDTKTMVAQNKYGGSSMYFDGTGDYLLMDGSTDFAFGTGDFTIELWMYMTAGAGTNRTVYDSRPSTGGMAITAHTTNVLNFYNGADRLGTTTLSLNTWYHIAISRSGGTVRGFVNGVQDISVSDAASYGSSTSRPIIGMDNGSANLFTGYIDDFRVTKGYARYVGNFPLPTAAFSNK